MSPGELSWEILDFSGFEVTEGNHYANPGIFPVRLADFSFTK